MTTMSLTGMTRTGACGEDEFLDRRLTSTR
jgi:hypothetical protein